MFRLKICAPLILIISLAGCATVFKSSRETVRISTDVTCTHVYVDGVHMGTAPLRVPMDPKRDHVITFKRQGFATQHYFLGHSISTGWVLVDILLGSVYAVLIDALTGDWKTLNTNYVHVPMVPVVRQPCGGPSGCDNY